MSCHYCENRGWVHDPDAHNQIPCPACGGEPEACPAQAEEEQTQENLH